MAGDHSGNRRLEPTAVFKGVGDALAGHWAWLLVACIVLSFIPQFTAALIIGHLSQIGSIPRTGLAANAARTLIRAVVNFAPAEVLFSLICRRFAGDSDGSGARLPALAGLDRAPILLLTRAMTIIAVTCGVIFFVVPGVLFSLAWAVAAPVVVVERLGPPRCFERSAELTRNHRGTIFLLGVIYTLGATVFGFAFGLSVGLVERAVGLPPAAIQVWISAATVAIAGMAGVAISSLGVAVIYRELIRLRGGDAAASLLAKVFD